MAFYRIVIPYGIADADEPSIVRRFVGVIDVQSAQEARRRAITQFQDLRLATGLKLAESPSEADVFIDDVDTRRTNGLEISSLEYQDGVFCIRLDGPLDSQTALQLDREVYALQQQGCEQLVLDLGHVHPIGSAGLGVLLNFNDRMTLFLVKVPVNAQNMMQMLGLEATMNLFPTFPDALAAIRK